MARRANTDRTVERDIGRRIRLLRGWAGISRAALAKTVGVSWQQVQKYETGKNRVSASRLAAIAASFDQPSLPQPWDKEVVLLFLMARALELAPRRALSDPPGTPLQ
jgi:transcriptional regulator with XRE-family HTH domain